MGVLTQIDGPTSFSLSYHNKYPLWVNVGSGAPLPFESAFGSIPDIGRICTLD